MNVSLILVVGSPFEMWVTWFWMLFFSLSLRFVLFHQTYWIGSWPSTWLFWEGLWHTKTEEGTTPVLAFFFSFKFQGWQFMEAKRQQAHLSSCFAASAPRRARLGAPLGSWQLCRGWSFQATAAKAASQREKRHLTCLISEQQSLGH